MGSRRASSNDNTVWALMIFIYLIHSIDFLIMRILEQKIKEFQNEEFPDVPVESQHFSSRHSAPTKHSSVGWKSNLEFWFTVSPGCLPSSKFLASTRTLLQHNSHIPSVGSWCFFWHCCWLYLWSMGLKFYSFHSRHSNFLLSASSPDVEGLQSSLWSLFYGCWKKYLKSLKRSVMAITFSPF